MVSFATTLYRFLGGNNVFAHDITISPKHAIVFGCNDVAVAQHAASLWQHRKIAKTIITGGVGRLSQHSFQESEATLFQTILLGEGVDANDIILEPEATHTGQNVRYALPLLAALPPQDDATVLICKPIMAKRVAATFARYSPKTIIVTSPEQQLPNEHTSQFDHLCHMMVGEIQRLIQYPSQGFCHTVAINSTVIEAYQQLIAAGYTEQMITAT